jgi:tripartite-type tricarboxylate transporter receptor subunit TctC
MAMLMLETDAKMTHVPFTGAGPAIVALLGGTVDVLATGRATVSATPPGGNVTIIVTG